MSNGPSLDRLLAPKSVAVYGGTFAEAAIRALKRMGYQGDVWPVHPSRASVEGLTCFPDTSTLPAAPDAAFIGVNRHATVGIVSDLSRSGAGGAVCYASGFDEAGSDGRALTADLISAAARMPVLGPNCYGFLNYLDGCALWPDEHGGEPTDRGVAIICQSSNIAVNLSMSRRGLPIGFLTSVGNQAITGLSDLIVKWACDARVSAIGLHIEGIDNLEKLHAAACLAWDTDTPVVVLNTGRTETGASLTNSHTAALSGSADMMRALFERLGFSPVDTLSQFLELLHLYHVAGRPDGNRLVSLSCSGGEAALVADTAARHGVDLPKFSVDRTAAIRETVNPLVNVANPFDYHTFDWGNRERLKATFREVVAADADIAALILDMPRADRCDGSSWLPALKAFAEATSSAGRQAAVMSSFSDGMPEDLAADLSRQGIVPFRSIDEGLYAIGAAVRTREPSPAPIGAFASKSATASVGISVSEWQAKQVLSQAGIAVPPGRLCQTAADIEDAFQALTKPLVAKSVSAELSHKTEAGAVRLRLNHLDEIQSACDDLFAISDYVLLEEMVTDGLSEMLVGYRRDPLLGPSLVVASGGELCELFEDAQTLLLPETEEGLWRTVTRLRSAPLLNGFRSRPVANRSEICAAILKLQDWLLTRPDIVELEINPLIIRPAGLPSIAVDCLLTLDQPEQTHE